MNIGEMMQATSIIQGKVNNPVGQLRNIIDGMKSSLSYFEKMNPSANTTKRWEIIFQLDTICQSLERSGPIEVWNIIWDKLGEAKRDPFDGDIARVIFPLKPNLPDYSFAKQVYIDCAGYDLPSPYAYDCVTGTCFVTSSIKEGGYHG